MVNSIQVLRVQHNKLEQANFRLKERDKILFQSCIHSINNKNKERAALCANEMSEVRRLIKFLYDIELAVERVILRLETIKELNDIVIDLKPALKLLQSVSQQLFEVLPDVSSELSKVNEAISDTLHSTKITADESMISVDRKTPEGEEIMKEVSSFLKQKVSERLPEPPATVDASEVEKTTLKDMVALSANCSQGTTQESDEFHKEPSQTLISYKKAEIQEISLMVEEPSLEDALLEYVKKSNGEIDMKRCSSDLKTSNEEIEDALQSLGAKGRIKIEVKAGE